MSGDCLVQDFGRQNKEDEFYTDGEGKEKVLQKHSSQLDQQGSQTLLQ